MTVDEAMRRMFTCATAEHCAREEACFKVVQWAKRRWDEEQQRDALFRAHGQQEIPDEIAYFTPPTWPEQWEMARTTCAQSSEIDG